MNLHEEIIKEHSRKNAERIAEWIGNDKKRFMQFLDIFLHGDYRTVQLSAYVLYFIKDIKLIEQNINAMFKRMFDDNIHVSVKRSVVRQLQYINIPKNLHARVINTCFNFLSDPNEAISIRVYSMTVLAKLAKTYPDIKNELEAVINTSFKGAKGGLCVRARDVLRELSKIKSVNSVKTN